MGNHGWNSHNFRQGSRLEYSGAARFELSQEIRDVARVRFPSPVTHLTADGFRYSLTELTIVRLWLPDERSWKTESIEFRSVRSGHNPTGATELISLRALPRDGIIREAFDLSMPPAPAFVEPRVIEVAPGGRGAVVRRDPQHAPFGSLR